MSNVDVPSVLDAAQQLLHEVGSGFTMDQLEERAGVSRATIYRRVGSKAELLDRLVEDRHETVDDVRTRILQATRAVIATAGLTEATIEQVAATAGVGVATVYRHFETKDRLLRSFIEEMTPRPVFESLRRRPEADVAAELETIVEALVSFIHDHRDIFRIMLLGGEAERRYLENLREQSDSTIGWLGDYFDRQQKAGRIKPKTSPQDLALGLMGMVLAFGLIGPLHYRVPSQAPEKAAKTITAMFLDDLKE